MTKRQQVEDLGLDGHQRLATAQLTPFRVEREIFEKIEQIASPRLRAVESLAQPLTEKDHVTQRKKHDAQRQAKTIEKAQLWALWHPGVTWIGLAIAV